MPDRSMILSDVLELDLGDPLRAIRQRFLLPEGIAYFDGHSLGPLPRLTQAKLGEVVNDQWGRQLIGGWNAGWIDAPQRVGAKIAGLIGAKPHEVIIADSTSVNLFKLIVAASRLSQGSALLTETDNFHTDRYIASGAAELAGLDLRIESREKIEDSLDSTTNLLLLTHVHYGTSERYAMAAVTKQARGAGALTIWDLCHSAGAVPLQLNRDGVELAVGCGYKYLNGGPGAPSFLYVAEHLQDRLLSPLRGWMGHAAPFDFSADYVPAPGIDRFLAGTPPILSFAALEAAIEAFDDVPMQSVWEKSIALFELFDRLMSERCPELICVTPRDASRRGSHIAFRHPNAFAICQALIAEGVIGDFRAPDIIRFGLTPLYLRFEDVWSAVESCAAIMDSRSWDQPQFNARQKVT
ncbi:kynureninase [Sphingomonas sp. RB56-2]|uniref:Kynureninase n=1 Tax=Sphingomonas brevis TaxID=2908206 RepID=A0ABT0SAL9_9SPHN|nr:kynureninase [Sphingomonas brevis]MCL6741444.1 kynureninase [Sphingomonas brevis]